MTATGPTLAPLEHPITSKWLVREGWRLDAAPFLSGKVEALQALEKLPTQRLADLTKGYEGGIYRRPQHNRHWVTDPKYGVPYIGSSDMLLADLSRLPLLRRSYAESSRLSCLRLTEGMTLISASGTIGRTVYCRKEMEGMWGSEDVMKIVPDPDKIPPGYLFAFLKSRYGAPLVVSGTYGAIIQHIEPEHLVGLSVPRLAPAIEQSVHSDINRASTLRAKGAGKLRSADALFHESLGIPMAEPSAKFEMPLISTVSARSLETRFDAHFFSSRSLLSRQAWDSVSCERLGAISAVFIPNIFKRRYASDKSYGYPYLTGGDVFCAWPETNHFLLKSVAEDGRLLLQKSMIVIQDSGQVGGLIGSSVMIGNQLHNHAATNNMVRILANDSADAGYLYTALRSSHGRRLLEREAFGTSIPHLDESRVASIHVPWPSLKIRRSISGIVDEAIACFDQAAESDDRAVRAVESAIGGSRG